MAVQESVPIRRLTLYKHGVGFVERQGTFSGEELRLVFRADEVNDALKSLLVLDRGGGSVLGLHYDTPADRRERLAESPLTLSDDHSLLDLLRALRGWKVRLRVGEGGQSEELSGRLLGVDLTRRRATPEQIVVTILDDATNAVLALPLSDLRRVVLAEERAERDLRFFLDVSRTEERHRVVTIRLSRGRHDLAISYLAPSPTWRVTYRLVAESKAPAANEAPGSEQQVIGGGGEQGSLLLQGWGLFDNRLEEDLSGVEVALVAGQPISFVYDLAASHIPQRPVVEDAARVAAGPVEFEEPSSGARGVHMDYMALAPEGVAPERSMRARGASALMARRSPALTEAMQAQVAAAAGSELGELFAYRVLAPVTVKRGESALVPILSARLPYRRLLLFNEQKLPRHPVATLRFQNDSGLVLERGPVTVLEDGAYHGEAVVPFSKAGAEVFLAFSVELGIKVMQERQVNTETAGIRIAGGILHQQQATVTRTIYRLENTLSAAHAVTIEHPRRPGTTLVSTPEPESRTADYYRWTVNCPARRATEFVVAQRHYHWQATQLLDQSYDQLAEYLRRRWLDRATLERLQRLLEEHAAIARNEAEQTSLQQEREQIYAREEQLRKNIAAIGSGGEEGAMRRQLVQQLDACERRVNEISTRLAALQQDTANRRAASQRELAALNMEHVAAAEGEE